MATKLTFGEKKTEKINGKEVRVIFSTKYETSKAAVLKLLESEAGKGLSESDFWIQKNKTKTGDYLVYSALIITHDALMKINATLSPDSRFNQEYCSDPIPFEYNGKKGLYMTYRDKRDGMFEIGEITTDSCKNDYPFAMLLKRTFDRVVKRKANLFGIYSDADDFTMGDEDESTYNKIPPASRAATTTIPKEEDELVVDADTGEILEETSEATEPKNTPHTLEEQTTETAPSLTAAETAEIEKALSHKLEGLEKKDGKGFTIQKLVESDKLSAEAKVQRLQLFAEKGTKADTYACDVMLAAIQSQAYVL